MSRLPKCAYKVPFARSDTQWSICYVHTPFMNIPGQSGVRYRPFTATWTNFWTQNQSDQNGKPVQLLEGVWQYHVYCRPKRPICGWKRSPRWTQMVMTCRMTVILLTFARWGMWVVVGPHGGNMKNWRFCSYGNSGDKNHCFLLLAE